MDDGRLAVSLTARIRHFSSQELLNRDSCRWMQRGEMKIIELSIDYVKVKTGMPSNVGGEQPVSKLKKPGRVQIIKQEPLRKSEGVCQSEV